MEGPVQGSSQNPRGIRGERAVHWLKGTQGIEKVAMTGASTGAGYTLVCASLSPESRIRVENMNADVLLLAAKNDDCWPSDIAVPRMLKVFAENNYPHRVEAHISEKGSHALLDGFAEMKGLAKFLLKTMIPAEKSYPKECEEARRDSCARIVRFIEEWA